MAPGESLDEALHERDQPVLRKQRRADGLHAAAGQRAMAGPIEAAKKFPDLISHMPQPSGVQHLLALEARRRRWMGFSLLSSFSPRQKR